MEVKEGFLGKKSWIWIRKSSQGKMIILLAVRVICAMTLRYENLSIKKIKIIVNCWNTDTWIQAGSEAGRKTEMMGGLCELKNLNYILNPRGSFKKKITLLSIITNVISSLKDELRGGKLAKRLLEQLRWEMRIWTKKGGLETEMEQIQETEHYQEVFMMEWMWEMRRFIPSHIYDLGY